MNPNEMYMKICAEWLLNANWQEFPEVYENYRPSPAAYEALYLRIIQRLNFWSTSKFSLWHLRKFAVRIIHLFLSSSVNDPIVNFIKQYGTSISLTVPIPGVSKMTSSSSGGWGGGKPSWEHMMRRGRWADWCCHNYIKNNYHKVYLLLHILVCYHV